MPALPSAKTPKPKTTPAATAIRNELQKLLKTEPFGIAQLTRIGDIANAGKSLLQATNPDIDPSLLGRARTPGAFYSGGINSGVIDMPSASLSPSNSMETFGARVLRDLVPALTGNKATPLSLVQALAEARDAGLDDVAAELKDQLDRVVKGESTRGDAPPTPTVQNSAGPGAGAFAPTLVSGTGGTLPGGDS